MSKKLVFFLWLFPVLLQAQNQEVATFLTYNTLNYRNETTYCTNTNNSPLSKENYMKTIFSYAKPDLISCNEVGANASNASKILERCLNVDGETKYVMAPFNFTSGSDLANAFFYNGEMFALKMNDQITQNGSGTALVRLVDVFQLYYKDANLPLGSDTTFLTVFSAHLKAGTGGTNEVDRGIATQAVMDYIAAQNITGNYIISGDFNVYSSTETAFQNLVDPSNTSIAFLDPINRLGDWNNNGSFADVHTQSTHFSSNGCASGGGLDDRFDFILISNDIKNNNQRIESVKSSYKALANDGNHFNQSINNPANTSVPANVLDAIYNSSDHLPVVLDMIITQAPPSSVSEMQNAPFKVNITNPAISELTGHLDGPSGKYTLRLLSVTGSQIYYSTLSNEIETEFSLPLPHRGIVFLEISDEKGNREIVKVISN